MEGKQIVGKQMSHFKKEPPELKPRVRIDFNEQYSGGKTIFIEPQQLHLNLGHPSMLIIADENKHITRMWNWRVIDYIEVPGVPF